MIFSELEYQWYHTQHTLKCKEEGLSFQDYFEEIMTRYDPTFVQIKPSGSEGDWGCDGISGRDRCYYAVYAPQGVQVKAAQNKIRKDLRRVHEKWGEDIGSWQFVTNAGLPAPVYNFLEKHAAEYPGITFKTPWGPDNLWDIVRSLPREDVVTLLRPLLSLEEASRVEMQEVAEMLDCLNRQPPAGRLDPSIEHLDLAAKLDRNRLNGLTRQTVLNALGVSRLVGDYVKSHPQPRIAENIALSLRVQYNRIADKESDPNDVFNELIFRLQSSVGHPVNSWVPTGVVVYFFELCDIFER